MASKDILVYLQISALLSTAQRGFIQQMKTNAETHSQTLCINSPSSEFREHPRRRGRMSIRTRGVGGHQENKAFLINMTAIYMNLTETEAVCTGPTGVCPSWGTRAEKRSRHKPQLLNKKQNRTDIKFTIENLISSERVSLEKQSTLKSRLHVQQQKTNRKKKLNLAASFGSFLSYSIMPRPFLSKKKSLLFFYFYFISFSILFFLPFHPSGLLHIFCDFQFSVFMES